MSRRAPPVVRVALAHAAGIALPLQSVDVPTALLALLAPTALILLWRSPWSLGVLFSAFVAGLASGQVSVEKSHRDCRLMFTRRWEATVEGRLLSRPVPGLTVPFALERGAPGGCVGEIRAVFSPEGRMPSAGQRIRVEARWEGRAFPRAEWADRAGILRLQGGWESAPPADIGGWTLTLRGRVQHRILELWGPRVGPIVEALVLARREHLDPDLREAFARSGAAHLLAISGFHVGIIAALLIGVLRIGRVPRAQARVWGVVGCWVYVLAIGAPHAAVRAALLLSLWVASRLRGRPVIDTGALGTALLALLVVRPSWLASVGFQLSFAGTAGLLILRQPIRTTIEAGLLRRLGPAFLDRRPGAPGRRVGWAVDGVAAGLAAGVSTLPLVALHFDRISLLSVPATLVLTPLVTAAIPGIGGALLLSLVGQYPAGFLAGGTALLLSFMESFVTWCAELPGASVWVPRGALWTGMGASVGMFLFLRHRAAGRVRRRIRLMSTLLAGGIGLIIAPLAPGGGTLDVHMIDVGQGDAVALRLPSRRWLLVDAGPRAPGFDAGARRVVPYLRRHGAHRLEAIVLTHPHLDHIGGAPSVLGATDVRGVLDASRSAGSRDYLSVLEAATSERISWWEARAGVTMEVDGVQLSFLHPDPELVARPRVADLNDLSTVLLVRWQEAVILLTGDASSAIERALLQLPRLSVLKVGHHGSRTSTSTALLDRTRPRVALVPVGDGNRFGHPHDEVIRRLERAGTEVYRTDRDGDVRLELRSDGTVEVYSNP